MFWSIAKKKEKHQVEILHLIQYRLGRKEQPTPRDVGLTETEIREWAADKLVRLEKLEDIGHVLDNYAICELLYPALVLLAKHPSPIAPLQRVQSQAPPVSVASGIGKGVEKGLLDVAKIVLNSLVSGIVGYLIGRYLK
jgi:hypothetical protein